MKPNREWTQLIGCACIAGLAVLSVVERSEALSMAAVALAVLWHGNYRN